MYYWSRWTSTPTTETEAEEARETRSSWRDTAPRLVAQRETRPVVVVARNRTQPLAASTAFSRERSREHTTESGISLDVRRSTYSYSSATRTYTPAGRQHEATTQPVIEAFRLK